jgi:hypothetical protein
MISAPVQNDRILVGWLGHTLLIEALLIYFHLTSIVLSQYNLVEMENEIFSNMCSCPI